MLRSKPPLVFVHVVTFNHKCCVPIALDSVFAQCGFTLGKDLLVGVYDNNSTDGTLDILTERYADRVVLIKNSTNTGFAAAHNYGIDYALSRGADYVFILNPDVRLDENALENLVWELENDPRAGMSCPKLYRADSDLMPVQPLTFDAAGMFITPALRHLDRGSQETDRGQYNEPEYLFGASGAAVLLRKEFIQDVYLPVEGNAHSRQVFDEAFFSYREDADLAWRAQWLGWKCRYVPQAVGYHERKVLPERRDTLPDRLNQLGVQNRFLLQLNNFNFLANWNCILPGLIRNLIVLGAVVTIERSSLPALRNVWKGLPRALNARRLVQKRKRVSPLALNRFFSYAPYSEPALSKRLAATPIKSITVIVVNFNSGHRLGNCLTRLSQAVSRLGEQLAVKVLVVDNGSRDDSAKRVEPVFNAIENFEFITNEQNLGFSGAINLGAKHCPGDAFLVLNPDIEIPAKSISILMNDLDNYSSLGAVSPVLVDVEDNPQLGFTARSFPTLGSTLAELFYLHRLWPSNPWTSRLTLNDDEFVVRLLKGEAPIPTRPNESPEKPLLVDQPAGAAILIRRTAFDSISGFDEGFSPAWFEDVDFCKRLRDAGWLAAVSPAALALHEGGYSKDFIGESNFYRIWYKNLTRYFKKHLGRVEYITLRVALPIALLLRSLVSFLDGTFPGTGSKRVAQNKLNSAKTLLELGISSGIPDRVKSWGYGERANGKHDLPNGQGFAERVNQIKRAVLTTKGSPQYINSSSLLPPQAVLSGNGVNVQAQDWREYFSRQLTGRGLELGPLHRPMNTHEKMEIQYVDRMSVADLRMHYPELESLPLVEPDIIDDGGVLSTVEDGSFDFLVSAHLIEHLPNPILGLKNWCRVVRPGGYIYLVVPDKRMTFDKQRVRTNLEHIVLDYTEPSSARDFEHYLDYARWVDKKEGNRALKLARELKAKDYSIHYHVFLPEDVQALLLWFKENVRAIQIVEGPCQAPGSDEFHFLLKV